MFPLNSDNSLSTGQMQEDFFNPLWITKSDNLLDWCSRPLKMPVKNDCAWMTGTQGHCFCKDLVKIIRLQIQACAVLSKGFCGSMTLDSQGARRTKRSLPQPSGAAAHTCSQHHRVSGTQSHPVPSSPEMVPSRSPALASPRAASGLTWGHLHTATSGGTQKYS